MKNMVCLRNFGLFIVIVSLLAGCKDEETGFTSLIGSWTYITPDEKMEVSFDIVGGDSELLVIQNQGIKIEGVEGKANIEFEDITETTIKFIRINANDAALIYPYNITFSDLSASVDFETIDVQSASYTFPWQNNITLSNIQIVRR